MKNDFSFLLFFVLVGIALTGKSYNAKKFRLIKHLKASIEKRRNLNKNMKGAPKMLMILIKTYLILTIPKESEI